jgi:hypothetical protein
MKSKFKWTTDGFLYDLIGSPPSAFELIPAMFPHIKLENVTPDGRDFVSEYVTVNGSIPLQKSRDERTIPWMVSYLVDHHVERLIEHLGDDDHLFDQHTKLITTRDERQGHAASDLLSIGTPAAKAAVLKWLWESTTDWPIVWTIFGTTRGVLSIAPNVAAKLAERGFRSESAGVRFCALALLDWVESSERRTIAVRALADEPDPALHATLLTITKE